MAAITLEIPEDIAVRLRLPPARASEELPREFAVFLVKEGILPRHEARKLAAMDRIAFDDLLAHRQVAWEGTAAEVFADTDAVDRTLDKCAWSFRTPRRSQASEDLTATDASLEGNCDGPAPAGR